MRSTSTGFINFLNFQHIFGLTIVLEVGSVNSIFIKCLSTIDDEAGILPPRNFSNAL